MCGPRRCTFRLRRRCSVGAYLVMKMDGEMETARQDLTTSGTTGSIDADLDLLITSMRGEVVLPEHPQYDSVRALYNGMIDRRPAVIARCRDAGDVIAAVNYGREKGLLMAIRSGGHNGPGLGSCDNGLMIDLSPMKGIRVDPEFRTVQVQPGCTWGDVDHATHAFGMATPSGIISTTGVGGLTLGGGVGHLTRRYGLAIDNLLEVDVVLADGTFVTANEREHRDLFWAVRGGGGNFGVVTSFLFRVHPVDTVVAGPTFWSLDQSELVLSWYRDFIRSAPEDLNGFFAFLQVPAGPPFPEHLHMQKMCGVIWCYTGPKDKADEAFAPVLEVGTPALHGVQEMPYPMLQSAFDALYPPGMQWYWKADFIRDIDDEAVALHVTHGARVPTMHSTMHLYPINGAAHRIGSNDTAWSFREANWVQVVVGVDPDPVNGQAIADWSREYWVAIHPHSAGGAYINMIMDEGQERVRASYRDNYDRLVEVKNRYDPRNLFCVNQNIAPSAR